VLYVTAARTAGFRVCSATFLPTACVESLAAITTAPFGYRLLSFTGYQELVKGFVSCIPAALGLFFFFFLRGSYLIASYLLFGAQVTC
jgi:hypothetical protein